MLTEGEAVDWIAAAACVSVFVLRSGRVLTAGFSPDGCLGTGPRTQLLRDDGGCIVAHVERVRQAAGGSSHLLFLDADGQVHSCGAGNNGQLGLGGFEQTFSAARQTGGDRDVPTRIPGLDASVMRAEPWWEPPPPPPRPAAAAKKCVVA